MRRVPSFVQKFLGRLRRLMSPWAKGFAPVANHQFVFWAATGLMVLGFVLLQELGRLLQAAQAAGSLSFGPGVYSGFNPTPWDTTTLSSAIDVWTEVDATAEAAGGDAVAQSIVRWHTAIDLFYVPVFACFLACAIKRLGARLNCLDTTSLTGPVSGAIDGGRGVQARGDGDSNDGSLPNCTTAEDTRSRISALTAGYLSARFPGVAPSGALYRCIARPTAPGGGSVVQAAPEAPAAAPEFDRKTTYAVDGGYIEGSGILTALQMWVGVQQHVREHNAKGVNCIEPWLVVLSSGYQSSASAADPGRPLELVLPLSTFLAANPVTTAALEQTSAAIFDTKSIPCGQAAPPEKSQPHVVHLSLSTSPEVAAPLGWVLSAQTLDNMCGQLKGAFARARIPSGAVGGTEPYDALGQLLLRLGFNAGATAPCTGRGT